MAITKNGARQWPLTARVSFTYAELGAAVAATTVVPAIDLPVGAIVTGGYLVITTAFVNAGGTSTIAVGDGDSASRYLGDTDDKSAALTALVPTGYKYTAQDTIDIDLAVVTAVLTAGAGELVVHYIVEGKANEVVPV